MRYSICLIILLVTLTGCGTMDIGTGQKFSGMLTNPEPDKYALVYLYRNDGWGYGGRAKNPLLVSIKKGEEPNMPVAVLNDQMYRPFLFEPQTIKLVGGSSEDVTFTAGEVRCFEQGWRWRGIDMIIFNEVKMDECKEALLSKELVHALNDIRRKNNGSPFVQQGFKELIPSPEVLKY